MGNDNEDRRNPFPKQPIVGLEERVNELYGSGVFDWTIGRVGPDAPADPRTEPALWFYYGGTDHDPITKKIKWKVGGHATTAADAMLALIAEHG